MRCVRATCAFAAASLCRSPSASTSLSAAAAAALHGLQKLLLLPVLLMQELQHARDIAVPASSRTAASFTTSRASAASPHGTLGGVVIA